MEESKKYLENKGLLPVRQMKVKSKSEKGLKHIVNLFANGKIECSCIAGMHKQNCRHQEIARKEWEESEGWRWKL